MEARHDGMAGDPVSCRLPPGFLPGVAVLAEEGVGQVGLGVGQHVDAEDPSDLDDMRPHV